MGVPLFPADCIGDKPNTISEKRSAVLAMMGRFRQAFLNLEKEIEFYFYGKPGSARIIAASKNKEVVRTIIASPQFDDTFREVFTVRETDFEGIKNTVIGLFGADAVSILHGVPITGFLQHYVPLKKCILDYLKVRGCSLIGIEDRLDRIAHETVHDASRGIESFCKNIEDKTIWSSWYIGTLVAPGQFNLFRNNILAGNWDDVPLDEADNTPEARERLRIDLSISTVMPFVKL